jgi:hypothetical protein
MQNFDGPSSDGCSGNSPEQIPNTFSVEMCAAPSITRPIWALNAELATNKIALGLDEGFLKIVRLYCETKQIGFIHTNADISFQKFDLPEQVFTEVLKNFCAKAELHPDSKHLRVSQVTYHAPDDSERTIGVYSDYHCHNRNQAHKSVAWPITSISIESFSQSHNEDYLRLKKIFKRIEAASNPLALCYQIEDQLQYDDSPKNPDTHVRVVDQDGSEHVLIENIRSMEVAEATINYLKKRLSGIGFQLDSYQKENDPLALEYWRLRILRTDV